MVRGVRIYVEGGSSSKGPVRRGFQAFLSELRKRARSNQIRWTIVASGSRSDAFYDFEVAVEAYTDEAIVLLIDGETPISGDIRQHLRKQDKWDIPQGLDEQVRAMVTLSESWMVCDIEALRAYYGQGFRDNQIPRDHNIENVQKQRILSSLTHATRNTKKGAYHKTRHAPDLFGLISSELVRQRAPHCERLFNYVEGLFS